MLIVVSHSRWVAYRVSYEDNSGLARGSAALRPGIEAEQQPLLTEPDDARRGVVQHHGERKRERPDDDETAQIRGDLAGAGSFAGQHSSAPGKPLLPDACNDR